MWARVLMILLIIAVIGLSILQRALLLKKGTKFKQIPDAPTSSFLSESLAQLVGMAGGVYISLTLIVSFLEIDLPAKVSLAGITMQPLALVALVLAILQPAVKLIFHYFANK